MAYYARFQDQNEYQYVLVVYVGYPDDWKEHKKHKLMPYLLFHTQQSLFNEIEEIN